MWQRLPISQDRGKERIEITIVGHELCCCLRTGEGKALDDQNASRSTQVGRKATVAKPESAGSLSS